jgi:hypothetical protein
LILLATWKLTPATPVSLKNDQSPITRYSCLPQAAQNRRG